MNDDIFKYWHKITNDLYVIKHGSLEDFRAVMGAKTSRSLMLEKKLINKSEIKTFLRKNLLGYGHASIGDMSFASVFHRGFGWLAAGILMDDPLFNGQEVSSRAVDIMTNFPDMCYDAPEEYKVNHNLFRNIFFDLKNNLTEKKTYKFDTIRWAMPGTIQTGVMVMMNVRSFSRHIDRMQSIPFCKEIVKHYENGISSCASEVFSSLCNKERYAPNRWKTIEKVNYDVSYLSNYENNIEITFPKTFKARLNTILTSFTPRKTRDMIDDTINTLGLINIKIRCPIYEVRDWKRHRTLMPWKHKLIVDTNTNKPFLNPHIDIPDKYKNDILNVMNNFDTQDVNELLSLYQLPFGTMIEIEASTSLNFLVYMLELRSSSHGANLEYKLKADIGLKKLRSYLGRTISKYFSIGLV